MKTLPPTATPYKRTPTFTESTIPAGLQKSHSTIEGAWAKITVEEGRLQYVIESDPPEEIELSPERFGVVEPKVLHHVKALGTVKFHVEFHRI